MVTERNWLDVYPYTKWGGNDSLPHLQEGQTFMPSHLLLKEVWCLDTLILSYMEPNTAFADGSSYLHTYSRCLCI